MSVPTLKGHYPKTPNAFILMTALCLGAFQSSFCQDSLPALEFAKLEQFTLRQVGVNGQVESMGTLPNGDIALTASNKLATFDGQRWRAIPDILRPSKLNSGGNGTTLIAHADGVSKVERNEQGENRFTLLAPSEFTKRIPNQFEFIASADGHLFAHYGRQLLEQRPDGSMTLHELENWATSIFSIDDEVYMTGGLYTLLNRWDWDSSELVEYQHPLDGSVYEWFTTIRYRKNGGVWMLSDQGKIVAFDGRRSWLWPGNQVLEKTGGTINDFVELKPDTLAIATNSHGILLFDSTSRLLGSVSTGQGLDSKSIIAISADGFGNLWAATKTNVYQIALASSSPSTRNPDSVPAKSEIAERAILGNLTTNDYVEILLKYGTAHIDRYTPRQTSISNEVRKIAPLPNGDLAILTSERLITFNGTYWQVAPEIVRPTGFFEDGSGNLLLAHAQGLSQVSQNEYEKNEYKLITPPNFIAHSIQPPFSIASARGHLFGNFGNLLVVLRPDGSTKAYKLENWASTIFNIGEEVYTSGGTQQLLNRWDWETEKLVDHQAVLDSSVYEWFTDIVPREGGGVWMLTNQNKIVGFDGNKTWLWSGNKILAYAETSASSMVEIAPDTLAVATNSEGVLIFDESGDLIRTVSTDQGLDSTGVVQIGLDGQNGLWTATKKSLNRIALDPATLLFDERHGLLDTVSAVEFFRGQIHLGTPNGVYVQNPNPLGPNDLFSLHYDVRPTADLFTYKDTLFIGGVKALAVSKNGSQTELMTEGANCFWQPSKFPDTILIGNFSGAYISRFENGEWRPAQKIEGADKDIFSFSESEEGTIMGSNGDHAITRIHLSATDAWAERISFDAEMGRQWTAATTIEGRIYTNTNPTLVWDEDLQTFVASKEIEYFKGLAPYGFGHSFSDGAGKNWAAKNTWRGMGIPRPNRQVVGEISSIGDAVETRASSLIYDSEGRAWAGGDFGLVLAPRPNESAPQLEIQPGIHRLVSIRDQVELPNRPDKEGYLFLEPHQNSLRIEAYLNSFHSPLHNTFQIYIEGLDTDNGPFTSTPFREFTNLKPGRYTIAINSLNTNGQQFHFGLPIFVKAPWYQQSWAYALFVLAVFVLMALFAWAFSRNQIRRRKRLENLVQERTQEIAEKNQTLEIQATILEKQNEELEEKTEELTATTETLTSTLHQLQETQDELLDTARTAGKAEIAINVLHNVGNVLNSLNVSLNLVSQKIDSSKIANLSRVAALLDSHKDEIDSFLTQDPKGKAVPDYLIRLSEILNEEVEVLKHELAIMGDDVEHIKSIIAAQQTHAKSQGLQEEIDIRELCENALAILGSDLAGSKLEIINDVPEGLIIESDKHRLLDIVLNLITNAQDAINDEAPPIGVITFHADYSGDGQFLDLHVKDNGSGIDSETMDKLFRHGFTTKADGHGFGLHSCANSAQSMGGKLVLTSPGKHEGATAILTIPRYVPKSTRKTDTKKAEPSDSASN